MAGTIYLKQNDRRPIVEGTATDQNDEVVPLTGASSVKFLMRKNKLATPKIDASATLVSAALGQLAYSWAAGDTDTVGRFLGEFQVTFSDGTTATFPNDSYIDIVITEDIA